MALTGPREEDARRELLVLMEELAGRSRVGRWLGGLEYQLWGMAQSAPKAGYCWSAESLPTDEQLRQLRDLSQRAGGWWHRRSGFELEEAESNTRPEFMPLPIWRRHYRFAVIAMPFAGCLGRVLALLTAILFVPMVPAANPTWSPLVAWPVGVLVGVFVLFLFLWFLPWQWIVLWLLRPIDWLLTARRPWLVGVLGGLFVLVWLLASFHDRQWMLVWLLLPAARRLIAHRF